MQGRGERNISWILLCGRHHSKYFTFMNPCNPCIMLKRRYSYLFPFIDKDIGLSVFIDLTASKGQNLNFHLGQLNYKSHPSPTMLCSLPTFPGSFPMLPPWILLPNSSSWTICVFLAQATSAIRSSPLPRPLLLLFLHHPLSSLSPLYVCLCLCLLLCLECILLSLWAFSITKSCLILSRHCGL